MALVRDVRHRAIYPSLWAMQGRTYHQTELDRIWSNNMSERTINVLLAVLAVLALALFVASGGDDAKDLEARAQWMAQAKEDGACVMW